MAGRARLIALLADADWLRRAYVEEKRSVKELAAEAGCSDIAVLKAMNAAGIPRRTLSEARALAQSKRPASRFPQLADPDWLRARYLDEGLTLEGIGALLGCNGAHVLTALRKHEIPRRRAGLYPDPKPSVQPILKDALGKEQAPHRKQRLADPKNSRQKYPQLHDPDWLRREYLEKRRTAAEMAAEVGCTRLTMISALHGWGIRRKEPLPRGEHAATLPPRQRARQGYVQLWTPGHPAARGVGFVYEHRLVAERELGRYLTDREVVHHVNEKRDDNRPENLIVFPDNATHTSFHENPPAWVPRCECCGKPRPELLMGRPPGVPMLWAA